MTIWDDDDAGLTVGQGRGPAEVHASLQAVGACCLLLLVIGAAVLLARMWR